MSEIIKLTDLKNGISGIYKLNYPNGKIYIGKSNDIKRRMYEHNNINRLKSHTFNSPCDLAIKKYGRFEEIEILQYCSIEDLPEREKFWIAFYQSNNKEKGYNLTPGGETLTGTENPNATFSEADVLDIRKRRFYGERKINVYQDYSNHPFGTFERVWLGRSYTNIGKQFIIPTNEISRQEYSSIANSGENNNKAKLTQQMVRQIRKCYDEGESITSISKDYSFVSRNTILRVCKRQTWKNVI